MFTPEVQGTVEVTAWRPIHAGVSLGEGRDTTLNRPVTLVRLEPGATDTARDEFLTAARRLSGGRHRSLATVLDVVEDGDAPYIVLESASGGTLRQWLAFFPPSQVESFRLAGEIVEGLLAARNLQITPVDLNLDSVWVYRAESAGFATRRTIRLLQFRPLESVDQVDDNSDLINGLGRVLFAMLAAGREPDPEKPSRLQSIMPQVSKDVSRFVEQLLYAGSGWTLETAARRISQLERQGQWRPLGWLAGGVLLGIAMISLLFGKSLTEGGLVPPRDQPGLATTGSDVATARATAEASTTVSNEVGFVSLPPLISTADFEPLSPGWSEFVVSLSPRLQVQAVSIELRRRNPGFDGQINEVDIQEEQVRGLAFCTDFVSDITPLAVLTHLEWVNLPGKSHRSGRLESLRPLQGLRLQQLRAGWTRVHDLTPLAGMPLRVLRIGGTRVENLAPLRGLPLEELDIWSTSVSDLGPLRELPRLKTLGLSGVLATDLTPLADIPLVRLSCRNLDTKDWSPLGKLPLQSLEIDLQTADQRAVLLGIKSLETINGAPVEEVLSTNGM